MRWPERRCAAAKMLLHTEQCRECPRLTGQIASRDPEDLALPDHLRRLYSLNRSPRCRLRSWSLHRAESAFDVPVIGLDAVVGVAPGPLLASSIHVTFFLQFTERRRVAAEAVTGENTASAIVRIRHRPLEEDLGGFAVTRFRQVEVHRLASGVDRPEQVHPATGDAHKRFIDVP